MKEHEYYLGKCDYNEFGRKNCKAYIIWKFEYGNFSMSAEIWNPRETDIYTGGQCVDTVVSYFPEDKKAQHMCEIWKEYHLNYMRAGTSKQTEFLESQKFPGYPTDYYEWASNLLIKAGLNPDDGYKYGSAWLKEEIPEDIATEIKSWS